MHSAFLNGYHLFPFLSILLFYTSLHIISHVSLFYFLLVYIVMFVYYLNYKRIIIQHLVLAFNILSTNPSEKIHFFSFDYFPYNQSSTIQTDNSLSFKGMAYGQNKKSLILLLLIILVQEICRINTRKKLGKVFSYISLNSEVNSD